MDQDRAPEDETSSDEASSDELVQDEAVDDDTAEDDAVDDDAAEPRGRRRVLRRALVGLGVLTLVLALAVGGGAWFLADRYAGNIADVGNVFESLDDDTRPAAATPETATDADPVTFLLVGSDTREEIVDGEIPDARSDAIMVARLSGDRQHVQVISIPRDSYVDIPGYGKNKINAAYAFGGPTLLIQTVENLTGVRIDHYAAISFNGLISMTDALGGVDVQVAETTSWGPYTFTAGTNHLDGDMARWYVGQRYDLPGGDFDRVRRQQNYLRALFGKLFAAGTFDSLSQIDSVLLTVTDSIAVDDTLDTPALLSLVLSARGITPDGIDFFTAPVLGTGTEGSASVVYLDPTTGARMWGYLQTDSLSQNAGEFADETLAEVPN
jgi:LCP family protein required for cell wall assembly